MMEEIRRKIVKTRKTHQCLGCLRTFERGTEMEATTYAEDDIYTVYVCETCGCLFGEFKEDFIDNDNLFQEGCVVEDMPKGINTPEKLLESFRGE